MKDLVELDRVVLIRPLFPKYLQPNPPIGLGYLATILEQNDFKVHIIDCSLLKISYKKVLEYMAKIKPIFIGITAYSSHYDQMKKLSHLIKKADNLRHIPLVLGGAHVTFLPEESIRECNADFVVIGEGELTIVELAAAIKNNTSRHDIKGIAFKENDKIIINKARELIEDIDEIPFPAWNLIPPNAYPQDPHGHEYLRTPYAPIFTTRGCPYKCKYCASTNFWGNKFRRRSPKNVVDEIELLMNKYGVREIHIWDDNFTLIRKHVIGICDEIIKRSLDLKLKCPNGIRIDSLDAMVLDKMKKAGFYYLVLAVESGSQRILNSVNKKLDLRKVPEIVKLVKRFGFVTRGFFILGLPTETVNSLYETINYAKNLGLDFAAFFVAVPLPGSKIFYEWKKNIKVKNFRWEGMDFGVKKENLPSQNLSAISAKDLLKFRNLAYMTFFFRFKTIYVLLSHLRLFFHWTINVSRNLFRRFTNRKI